MFFRLLRGSVRDATICSLGCCICCVYLFEIGAELSVDGYCGTHVEAAEMTQSFDRTVEEMTNASLMNASQSPEYTMPRRAFGMEEISLDLTDIRCKKNILTFSNRDSAYISSACLSTSFMLLTKSTPEPTAPRVEATYPASRDPRSCAFLRC